MSPHPCLTDQLLPPLRCGHKRGERQLKKRMDGSPSRIDRRHTGRRHHRHLLPGDLFQSAQKGGLSRPRLTGNKQIPVGM